MTPVASSIWPTPLQESLLRLVLGPEEQVEERWRALQTFDLNELDPGTFCLLPLLHTRLEQASVEDPLFERIAGTYRSTWYRNQIAVQRLASLLSALGEQGVDAVVFGGPSAAQRFYPQLGHRPIPQLDLLVRPDRLGVAREVVAAQAAWQRRLERADYLRFEDADRFVVVVHAGAPRYAAAGLGAAAALELLLPRARPLELGGVEARVLSPADEVVLAAGLGARATVPPTIQWVVDAAVAVRSLELTGSQLARSASELRLVAVMRDLVGYLQRVLGPQEPGLGELQVALAGSRAGRRETLAYRLGERDDRVSQRVGAYLRGKTGASLARTVLDLPRDLRSLRSDGPQRRASTGAR